MHFASGLGYRVPLGAVTSVNAIPAFNAGGAAQSAQFKPPVVPTLTPTVAITSSDFHAVGTATSDGKLVMSTDGWHVVSDQSEIANAPRAAESSQDIVNNKERIFVGAFPWNPSSSGGQLVDFISPTQVPPGWGKWINDAIDAALKAGLKPQSPDLPDHVYLPNVPAGVYCPQSWCNCSADPNCWLTITKGSKVWAGKDASGAPAEYIQYPNDPNTYGWYTPWDWLEGLQPGLASKPGVMWALGNFGQQTDAQLSHQFFDYDPTVNLPPIAKFKNPVNDDVWGVWLTFTEEAHDIVPGAWNSATDRPNSYRMVVGIGPMPSEPWYDSIIDALVWVPSHLADLAVDVINAIQNLVCSDPAKAKAMAGASPYAQAALIAAAQLCPKPPSVTNCTDPANAGLPQCMPPAKPWWQQWYVIVPAIVLVIALFSGGHKPAQAQKG